MSDQNQRPQEQEPHEERISAPGDDSWLSARALIYAGIGLVGAIVLILITSAIMYFSYSASTVFPHAATTPISPPKVTGPALQVSPAANLQAYRQTQQAQLNSYGWVNQSQGIARIPIDLAMQIEATQGLTVSTPAAEVALPEQADMSGFPHPTYQPSTPPAQPSKLLPPPGATVAVVTPTPVATQAAISPSQGNAQAGAQLFQSLGCSGCHQEQNTGVAPTLHGVYESTVTLQNGQTVTADAAYLQESILDPGAQVVKGFNPIMPSFKGRVDNQQLADLMAYIASLK